MREHNDDSYKSVALLGSFGKHYDLIVKAANIFKANGLEVLVPGLNGRKDKNASYILLEGDSCDDPKELEKEYIKKCLTADFVYVCNKDGYIGSTVAFELGILNIFRQEIFFMEKPSDDLFFRLINCPNGNIGDPETIVKRLQGEVKLFRARGFFDNDHEPRGDDFQLFNKPPIDFTKSQINRSVRDK